MPFLPSLWTRYEFQGTPIYLRGDRPDWFVPNPAGDALLKGCDPGWPDSRGSLEVAARLFLERLPDEPVWLYPGRAALLRTDVLKELWFHLTNRCNQSCRHCLFASRPGAPGELSAAQVLDLARQGADLGCRVFALTGGEPLVHPELPAMVDALLALDGSHVVVLTNGLRLPKLTDRLQRWPQERFHLQISLDGLEDNHDRLRGPGAFKTLMSNLAGLRGLGLPFTLSMCVDRQNLADMPAVAELAAAAGAANLHFLWYFVRGRGTARGFAPPEDIFPQLVAAAGKAAALGLSLDNLEALKSQVFAPSGTICDGAGGGWESLAVGPDGCLYPSPALVGLPELATPMAADLASVWRQSPTLERLRQTSAASLTSPWRFLLGGGDPDHSYLAGGTFTGGDPYTPLFENLALWLMAQEAAAIPDNGHLPGLKLKMGDLLRTCGNEGPVALLHSNCLLAAALPDSRASVKEFYTQAVQAAPTEILNPVAYPEELISHLPLETRFRGYGCGSPVLDAALKPGEHVLDLGCGPGVECFLAARLVGEGGRAVGVDMLAPMLALARRGAQGVAANLGYDNLEFHQGYLEDLPLPAGSVEVVLSNCVINLSSHKRRTFAEIFRVLKPGGRLVIADVVTETEPAPALKNNERLRGECLAGALTQKDLFGLLREAGFVAAAVLKYFPYRLVQGHQFFSMTYRAYKPAAGGKVRAMYRGPGAALVSAAGELLPAGCSRDLDLAEVPAWGEEVFILDPGGKVLNVPQETPPCCLSEDSPCCAPAAAPGRPEARRRPADCMVCGAPVEYRKEESPLACTFCGQVLPANARCGQGHFVCDNCHLRDAYAVLEHCCRTSTETDMIALLQQIRQHPAIPRHGPEHHPLVAGVILTAYRNLGGEVTPEMLASGLSRGRAIPGGACGFLGTCGAVTGAGIAFSLILGADPLKARERRQVQAVTQALLQEVAAYEAARCCQRESWLVLQKAAQLSVELLPIPLAAAAPLACRQAAGNPDCLGPACPLWAGVEGSSR